MKKILYMFVMLLLTQFGWAQNIDYLLNELARKDDLSQYTKKDISGFITIFTREDLDRMKIRSFDELIDKIPFLKNKLDNLGTNEPYYQPYQPNSPGRIRLFINDREVMIALVGSGLRFFGQADISYIDHIEVYHGLPSYEISIEPSIILIKAYTKVGERENTTTVGTSIGNHGTTDTYAYKSEKLDDYSYLAYINHRNLNRDKVHNLGKELSKDKQTTNLYTQLSNETSNFEFQIIDGVMDRFAGDSWDMTPLDSYMDFKYIFSSYAYTSLDKSLNASLQYTHFSNKIYDTSNSLLWAQIESAPFFIPYNTAITNTTEHLFDSKLTKSYTIKDTSLLLGISNKFKKFNIDTYEIDGISLPQNREYDSEDVVSVFSEVNHSWDENNQIILSLNAQRYFENGDIDEENLFGTRLGHIYKNDNFTQKSFIFYGFFHPSPSVLLHNDSLSLGLNKLDSETSYAISTLSLWNSSNVDYSLLLSRTFYKNNIFFDGTGYHNYKDTYIFDALSFDQTYAFNSTDKIAFNLWGIIEDFGKSATDRYSKDYGGSLSLYKKFYSIDTYNSLSYVRGITGIPDGWNYNATITYAYSKQLSFFLKGKNLLNKALTSDYISINPLTNQVTTLNNIANTDRSVWLGLEYQF